MDSNCILVALFGLVFFFVCVICTHYHYVHEEFRSLQKCTYIHSQKLLNVQVKSFEFDAVIMTKVCLSSRDGYVEKKKN